MVELMLTGRAQASASACMHAYELIAAYEKMFSEKGAMTSPA